MSLWQPRSVLQLVVIGVFAALAPLGVAILFTVQTLGELTDNNRDLNRVIVDASRLGQEVQGAVLELERRARQYLTLEDPELSKLFEREKAVLLQDLQTLQSQFPSKSLDITALRTSLQELQLNPVEELTLNDPEHTKLSLEQQLKQSFSVISEQGRAIERWLQASIDQLVETSAEEADELIRQLVFQLSILACATLALFLLVAYLINRPLRDLTEEIHQLGTEGLTHSIEISGPQEVQELGSKLEWLRQQLHESDQQKQQFLRHISHELKTPLASLREGADLLAEQVTGRLSQQQQEIVEIVRLNGIELQRLIENLLDYNQVPNQTLNFEKIDLDDLLENLLRHYRFSIESKSLKVAVHGSVDAWVADRHKLRTSLDNLLSNAVNYTPDGGRIVVAWCIENANLTLTIANSGKPIPSEDAERVFEPFFQSNAKRTGPIKGSGIGLSVARECMELQGGSLSLVSHDSLPVCFRLTCPAH